MPFGEKNVGGVLNFWIVEAQPMWTNPHQLIQPPGSADTQRQQSRRRMPIFWKKSNETTREKYLQTCSSQHWG